MVMVCLVFSPFIFLLSVFYQEIFESVQLGYEGKSKSENILLEINGSKCVSISLLFCFTLT